MTLDEYLKKGIRSADEVAERAGLTVASISRIRNGHQKPSFDAIRGLVTATDHAVTSDELLGLVTRPRAIPSPRTEQAA